MEWFEKYKREDFCRYGVAPTVAGEIASALTVIVQRWNHDHYRLAIGEGCEYVDFAARYLYDVCGDTEVEEALDLIWGLRDDESYTNGLQILTEKVVDFLNQRPELCSTPNDKDMWDYAWDEDFWDRKDYWDDEEEVVEEYNHQHPWAVYDPQ